MCRFRNRPGKIRPRNIFNKPVSGFRPMADKNELICRIDIAVKYAVQIFFYEMCHYRFISARTEQLL